MISKVWDKDLKFGREIAIHKDFPVLSLVVNDHKQLYSSGRDGSLRYFRRPWSHDYNDIMLQTVMDDVTCLYIVDNILYSGDDKGIVTKWYHNQVGCQYNVLEEVRAMAVEGELQLFNFHFLRSNRCLRFYCIFMNFFHVIFVNLMKKYVLLVQKIF